MEKRILSVCLTACMLLTLMPSAFAADVEQPLPIAGMEQTEETSADARTVADGSRKQVRSTLFHFELSCTIMDSTQCNADQPEDRERADRR